MEIVINGERKNVDSVVTLTDLLARLKLDLAYLAVAVNDKVIPRSEHAIFKVNEGDRIEAIHAVGGG